MELVRERMGPDAVIISSTNSRKTGSVQVRAAVELSNKQAESPKPADPNIDAWLQENLERRERHANRPAPTKTQTGTPPAETTESRDTPDLIDQALDFHDVGADLAKALRKTARALGGGNTAQGFAAALDACLKFAPVPALPQRPILLIGAPGSGKTITTAKLSARAVLRGSPVDIVSADTLRTGAAEQLSMIANVMNQTVQTVDNAQMLADFLGSRDTLNAIPKPCFVDCPATNPYDDRDLQHLESLINVADVEPVLICKANVSRDELCDQTKMFAAFGVRRLILSQVDVSRRLGSALTAADHAGLSIAQLSASPYVADGLEAIDAAKLSERLLATPQSLPVVDANSEQTSFTSTRQVSA